MSFRPPTNGNGHFFNDALGPPPEDVKPPSAAVAVVRPFVDPAAAAAEEPERGKWLSKGVFLRAQAAWKKGPLTYEAHKSFFGKIVMRSLAPNTLYRVRQQV